MDVLEGIGRLGKLTPPAHRVRQHIRQLIQTGVQPLPHGLQHGALIQTGADSIHGDDPAGDLSVAIGFFIDRIGQRPPGAVQLDLPEKDVALPAVQVVLDVGLIKKSYVNRSAVIHRPQLHELQPASHTGQARRVRNHGLDAHRLPVAGEGNGLDRTAVLIFAGEIRNKVTQRKDAELCQRLRLFLSDALDITNVRIQICHAYSTKVKV